MGSARQRIDIPGAVDPAALLGPADAVLRRLEAVSGADVCVRGRRVLVSGDEAACVVASHVLAQLVDVVAAGGRPEPDDVDLLAGRTAGADDAPDGPGAACGPALGGPGRPVRPKTPGQARYVEAIASHPITFGIGPAGTGKTYLAMAAAVAALRERRVRRIVLTRPVVEAGESLGFLPGTLEEKLDPYVRPLNDALADLVGAERAHGLVERGVVEVAPLAFMRGRTFNDAFVILDEAQNTSPEQMKMFLTRLGFSSRFVVTGDVTQRDLPGASGIESARRVLGGIDDIAFVDLGRNDIVRHALVARIVDAYARAGAGMGD